MTRRRSRRNGGGGSPAAAVGVGALFVVILIWTCQTGAMWPWLLFAAIASMTLKAAQAMK